MSKTTSATTITTTTATSRSTLRTHHRILTKRHRRQRHLRGSPSAIRITITTTKTLLLDTTSTVMSLSKSPQSSGIRHFLPELLQWPLQQPQPQTQHQQLLLRLHQRHIFHLGHHRDPGSRSGCQASGRQCFTNLEVSFMLFLGWDGLTVKSCWLNSKSHLFWDPFQTSV